MDGPPLYNGEVVIENSIIQAVRPCQTPSNERRDFGNAVLLPGLINAHTHLEYTVMRGFLEDVPFFPWIRALTEAKVHLSTDDWLVSAKIGALECLASGTTTIGDNTDAGVTVDAARNAGLRGTIYQEFFCIDHRTSTNEVIDELAKKVTALIARTGRRLRIGVSPHATYTVNPAAFRELFNHPQLSHLPLSIHVAESPAEVTLIASGAGPFAEMFKRREIEWTVPGGSATRYVADQQIMGNQTLLIHCVHQDSADIEMARASGSPIIHCPKSNAKLGAGVAPLAQWLATDGLRLGIGTDSAVSNNSLDLFEEMRFALLMQRGKTESVDCVSARDVLEMATIRGADAMGLGDSTGSLTPGKQADMVAVCLDSLHTMPSSDPISALVYSARASDVALTVVGGDVCYDDGKFPGVDLTELASSAAAARRKLPEMADTWQRQ